MSVVAPKILRGKELRKIGKAIVQEYAELRADLAAFRPMLRYLRGAQRDAIKSLIEEHLPEEAGWSSKPENPWGSFEWLVKAEHLRSAAYKWRAGGRPKEAQVLLASALEAEQKGKKLREQGK
jgi:hypothetical protein